MATVNCISLADIDEAVSCADMDNLAGVIQQIVYGYWDDVATWPDLPAPSGESGQMSFDEAGKWDGNITMKTGKYAYKLVVKDGSGEFTMTDQGETGGESVRYQLDVERTKMNSVIFGFANATRNRRLFLLVTDRNGVTYLMGDKLNAARRVAADAATTGRSTDSDVNKTPLRFQYDCPRNLVYTGDPAALLEGATAGS